MYIYISCCHIHSVACIFIFSTSCALFIFFIIKKKNSSVGRNKNMLPCFLPPSPVGTSGLKYTFAANHSKKVLITGIVLEYINSV